MSAARVILARLGACDEAIDWAGNRSPQAAWDACGRPEWLFWVIGRTCAGESGSPERMKLVMVACEVARTAIQYVEDEEEAAIAEACLQTVEAWANGEATIDDVREARQSAYAVAVADADAVAYAAAYAVADAVAYADAAGSAWSTAYAKSRRELCDLIRSAYPKAPKVAV